MRNDKDNIIVKKTFDFSLGIIDFSEELRLKNKFEMCSQLFRSGTSIGANTWEAQNAESKEILYISLKSLQKKEMKPRIGYNYVRLPNITQILQKHF